MHDFLSVDFILNPLAVPQEVDSYHGLCPIEPLDTPTDQVSSIRGAFPTYKIFGLKSRKHSHQVERLFPGEELFFCFNLAISPVGKSKTMRDGATGQQNSCTCSTATSF